MRTTIWLTGPLLGLVICAAAYCCGGYGELSLLQMALSEDPEVSQPAIAKMREQGPKALQTVVAERDLIKVHVAKNLESPEVPSWLARVQQFDRVIDQVGGQRYCSTSGLYWYTDFEKAKAAAAEQNKPILALRMLGKLTEEHSCANSRFFRTTLYANEEISRYLRDNYILQWEMVREVPKLTIDYGDGQVVHRTITGNSAHYITDAEGRPLDVLPGLYDPQSFLKWAREGVVLHTEIAKRVGLERDRYLTEYHTKAHTRLIQQWISELRESGDKKWTVALLAPSINTTALEEEFVQKIEKQMDEEDWQRLASIRGVPGGVLDQQSRTLIRSENPTALQASRLAITKSIVEDPVLRMIRDLEASIALDTVQNEYRLRRQVHRWFTGSPQSQLVTRDLAKLNYQVYRNLFLMPLEDPWLGLVPADQYSGLVNGGGPEPNFVVEGAASPPLKSIPLRSNEL